MDYKAFKQLASKPRGVVSELSGTGLPLEFSPDQATLLAMLED